MANTSGTLGAVTSAQHQSFESSLKVSIVVEPEVKSDGGGVLRRGC